MANAILITVSQSVGLDFGVWRDLTNVILADWISGGFGMLWVKKPYVQGVSKKPTCEVTNKHAYEEDGTPLFEIDKNGLAIDNTTLRSAGGISTIQLESLQNEEEVEERFKPRRYTCAYVCELSTFRKRKTFTTWTECLRSVTAREDDSFLFLADTNPADEGPDSWIYEVWFDLLGCDESECDPNEIPLKRNLDRIDFEINDNIFDPPERLEELKAKYFYDKDLYDRYILGIWRKSSEDSIFNKVFLPRLHCIGDEPSKVNPDPEMMFPDPDCIELISGWDPGPSNCAACILEQVRPKLDRYANKPVFKVLDELVLIGEDVDLMDFVSQMLEKMDFWERSLGKKVLWQHWSDRNVFDVREMSTNKFWHQLIYEFSNARINLMAAERCKESVNAGLELMKQLLYENRLFLNSATCPAIKVMFQSIRRKKNQLTGVDKSSPHKHALDCLRYPLQMVCYQDLNWNLWKSLRKKSESSLVSIPG